MTTRYGAATALLMALAAFLAAAPKPLWSQQDQRRAYQEAVRSGPVPYKNMREALAAMKSTDTVEVQRARDYFPRVPIQDHDDLKALYEEAVKAEDNVPLFVTGKEENAYVARNGMFGHALRRATAFQFQDDVAAMLENETARVDGLLKSPIPTLPESRRFTKAAMLNERLDSLIQAAGDGKNEKARTALWKLVDMVQDEDVGQAAVQAIGKLQHPEDLDRLIGLIEKNPKLRLGFGSFGPMVIPRLLKEMDNPTIPDDTKIRMTVGFTEVASHDTISSFVPLLNDKRAYVAEAANDAINSNLRKEDGALIRQLIKDKNEFRRSGIKNAICDRAWSDEYVPLLIDMLQHDPSYWNRAGAAFCLGHHKVTSAIPALQAALKDPVPHVRRVAQYALNDMGPTK